VRSPYTHTHQPNQPTCQLANPPTPPPTSQPPDPPTQLPNLPNYSALPNYQPNILKNLESQSAYSEPQSALVSFTPPLAGVGAGGMSSMNVKHFFDRLDRKMRCMQKNINQNPPPASKAAMAAPVARPMRLAAWGSRYNAFRTQNGNKTKCVRLPANGTTPLTAVQTPTATHSSAPLALPKHTPCALSLSSVQLAWPYGVPN
jgi:hypothetical protein